MKPVSKVDGSKGENYSDHEKADQLQTINDHVYITKAEFVAVKNRYHNLQDELESNIQMSGIQHELSILFKKFQTCYNSQQRLLAKVRELSIYERLQLIGRTAIESEELKEETELELAKTREYLNDAVKHWKETEEELLKLQRRVDQHSEIAKPTRVACIQTETTHIQLDSSLEQGQLEKEKKDEHLEEFNREKYLNMAAKIRQMFTAVADFRTDLKLREETIQRLKDDVEKAKQYVKKRESEYGETDRIKEELVCVKRTLREAEIELRSRAVKLKNMLSEKDKLWSDKKHSEDEVQTLEREICHYQRKVDLMSAKIEDQERCLARKDSDIKLINSEIESLQKESKDTQGELEKIRDFGQMLKKDRDNLKLQAAKLEENATQLRVEKKFLENRKTILQRDLGFSREKIGRCVRSLREMEKQNETLNGENCRLKKKIDDHFAEKVAIEKKLFQCDKMAVQHKIDMSKETQKSKQAFSDLGQSTKLYKATKSEYIQEKEKYGALMRQCDYLKLIIREREDETSELRKTRLTLRREKQALMEELSKQTESATRFKEEVKHLQKHEKNMAESMSRLETKIGTLKQAMEVLSKEKNDLQVIANEKDVEIESVISECKTMENSIRGLEQAYNRGVEDNKTLTLHVKNMTQTAEVMKQKEKKFEEVNRKFVQAEKELAQEKARSKNLEEEMMRPVNIHRWRVLEKCDPDRVQLLTQAQSLQKRIMMKTKQLKLSSAELKKKDRRIQDLQEKVNRAKVNEEAAARCLAYRHRMNHLEDQVRILTTEIRMYEASDSDCKCEISRLREELKRYKLAEYKRSVKSRSEELSSSTN